MQPFLVTGPCSCTWTKSWTFAETAECLNHITECDSAIVVLSFLLYKLGGTNHLGAKGPDSSYCRCSWKTTGVLNCSSTLSRNDNKLESATRCLVTASFQLPVDITNDRLCSLQIPGQVHECNCRNWQDSLRIALLSFIYIHEHSVNMNIQEHSWTISGLGFKTWLMTSLCSHEICSPLRHRDGANTLHATFINNIICIYMHHILRRSEKVLGFFLSTRDHYGSIKFIWIPSESSNTLRSTIKVMKYPAIATKVKDWIRKEYCMISYGFKINTS